MEHTNMISPGQLVLIKTGRDAGEVMMILEIINDHFVLIVDGKRRTLDKPKRKNIKHLQKTNYHVDKKHWLVDRHIRNEIKNLIHGQEEM